jgi:glycyl-tRNA synthetase alpha subunit
MKKIQFLSTLLLLFLVSISYAQDVVYKDKTYTVKGKSIYLAKKEVTTTLSEEMKQDIFAFRKINEAKELEVEKAENEKKLAEKKMKKAEKALKNKVKAQKKLKKANSKLKAAIKKHQTLKKKGDISPNDEKKWLRKIEKLKKKITKSEKSFNKA